MNTRLATILAREDLNQSGTKVIDINILDLISRIMVVFTAKNGADAIIAHPAANVTKIEIVDGSDVLFSLSGKQAQGVNFYDRPIKPFNYTDTIDAHWNTAAMGIDFGRFLFDQALAFDPKKFTNPQLKITWDERLCQANCSDNYCTVLADIFDELVPTPTGFFMTKEIYNYTIAETGYEYIDLPTDYITQQIFVRTQLAENVFEGIIDELKLSEDNDKRIPLDISTGNLIRRVLEQYPPVMETSLLDGQTSATDSYVMPTDIVHVLVSEYGAIGPASAWTLDGGKIGYIGTNATGALKAIIFGYYPHGVAPLLPKPGPEIADWYDVTKLGSLRLRIKDSAASATTPSGQVITKQYRTY